MATVNSRDAALSFSRSFSAEVALYFCAFSAVYFLVLQFIFPGYFDPFWPHHADLYIPLSLANSYPNALELLTFPRPAGFLFLWAIGHLGPQGAVSSLVALQALNFSIVASIFRRVVRLDINATTLISVGLFAYLIASHPFQYQFSTMDATASFSLLLLLLAYVALFFSNNMYVAFALALIAFLTKETFALSAIFLCACVGLQTSTRKRGMLALLMLICALAIALALEHFLSSPFTGSEGEYGIDFSPVSVLRELTSYISVGLNPLTSLVILGSVAIPATAFGLKSRECMTSAALVIAGVLAITPNALLPNHHYEGYCFNAAYFMYCPLIGITKSVEHGKRFAYAYLLIAVVALASPLLSGKTFSSQQWIAVDEKRQRLILDNVEALLPEAYGKTVLVSGLNVADTIFWHRSAIRSIPSAEATKFYVIRYDSAVESELGKRIDRSGTNVTFVTPDQIRDLSYSEAWLFRSDGSLEQRVTRPHDFAKWEQDGLTELDFIKYPELKDAFPTSKVYDGNNYIACGSKLIDYRQYALAEVCLRKAINLAPTNPYSHFFLGISLEQQGKTEQARIQYQQAVDVESESPNPAFRSALERMR